MSDSEAIADSVPRSFLDDYPDGLGGNVERFDHELGVSGWALNIRSPEQLMTVEMVIDDQVIARCQTGIARPDVAAGLAAGALPGFQFAEAEISRLADIACFCTDLEVTFRIGQTQLPLDHSVCPPTLARLFPAAAMQAGRAKPVEINLAARLSELQRLAAGFTGQPWQPAAEQRAGFIEAMAIPEGGCIWLSGWLRPIGPLECSAAIVSLQTGPAGFAFALFDRADLPAGCFGFIGVLLTSWCPVQGYEVHIHMDRGGKFLYGTPAMRVVPFAEFGENAVPLLAKAHTGQALALRRMLPVSENWHVGSQSGIATSASVDQILVLPGFGALVCGWVISPLRQVRDFALRLGPAILTCDHDSLYYKSRPDLAEAIPGNESAWRKAGFVAAFRGNISPYDLCDPILKLVYEDGSSSNHALDRQALRRIGEDAGPEEAQKLFPSLTCEMFFEEFASALRGQLQARHRDCWPYAVSRAKQVLVFAIPDDVSDMFLLINSVDQTLRAERVPPAVTFIGSKQANRMALVSLFHALSATSHVKYSLFWMDDPAYAVYGLPLVLAELGATSFAFIAAGIFLTETGWRAALSSLPQPHPRLHLLEIDDPASPERQPELSARAFIWSSLACTIWLRETPFFLNGFYADNGLGGATDHISVHHNAARRARVPHASRLIESLNRLALRP